MDSSLATDFIVNAGVAGVIIVCIILKILVPGWYVKKLEKQAEISAQTAQTAVAELQLSNRLVAELRAIAIQRAGAGAAGQLPGGEPHGNT